jgi:hypothetical protein
MDDDVAPAAAAAGDQVIAIALVVRRASDPIDGTIALADGDPVPFTGWMQLTRLLSRAVDPPR